MTEASLFRVEHAGTNDSGPIQTVDLLGYAAERLEEVIRLQHYGSTNVPPVGSHGVGLRLRGESDLAVALGLEHQDYRPKNYKPGERSAYDDQGQYSQIARDGHHRVAKQHTMTAAGDSVRPGGSTKPDTVHELNEQLKGLSARMAQAEHGLHGLFDVTGKFREIVQKEIPAVAAVAPILNMDPSGLKKMADAIEGKAQAYLQKQVEQALGKFLSPNLAGLQSLLGGGLEGLIGNLEGQVASLIAANPVVGQVDDLVDELAGLEASGAAADVIEVGSLLLQSQIGALTAANPIVGQVAGLRNALQGLIDQAGPALNFLGPQKRLVQGLTKSLRLAKA